MAYPNIRRATGLWKLKNLPPKITEGEFPEASNGGRTIFNGGNPITNVIDFIETSSLGNATDFGDLAANNTGAEPVSNKTRTLMYGGYEPGVQYSNRIQYITPQTQGNTSDFGDIANTGSGYGAGCNNDTRSVIMIGNEYVAPSGGTGGSNTIQFNTFSTLANSTDFGDLTNPGRYAAVSFGDGKRGFFAGGRDPDASPSVLSDAIDFFTIASTGNTTDFGDMSTATHYHGGCSSNVSGFMHAGGAKKSSVDKINLLSTGNATDFNDLTLANHNAGAAASSQTRAIYAGGDTQPAVSNVIQFHEMATSGNYADFGDLTQARRFYGCGASSNNNPGISTDGFARPDIDPVGDIGFVMGGATPSSVNTVEQFSLASSGNAEDFGNLTGTSDQAGGFSDVVRAVRASGHTAGSMAVTTDTIFFQSKGNAADFGDSTQARRRGAGLSNNTRGVHGGGHTPTKVNTIDYYTIASSGNATDFGDLASATTQAGATSSSTRGVFGGGNTGSAINVMQYITIASTGDTTDFGDLTVARSGLGGSGSDTRGLFNGGYPVSNVIDFITIASTGDATDFGDLTVSRQGSTGSLSNKTRGLFAGGYAYPASPATSNVIDSVTIASTGNATDHGDLIAGKQNLAQASNGHGGL